MLRKFHIPQLDSASGTAAKARQDTLTKPRGSLGELEVIACRLAAIQRNPRPVMRRKYIVVAAADHGVAAEGVSPYPSEVTAQMVANFLSGGAAINVLARQAQAEVIIIDAGVASPVPGDTTGLRRAGAAMPTRASGNIARGPAMTTAEAAGLVMEGADLASELVDRGADVVATGEMGIGNTTPATALTSLFTHRDIADVTGRGSGLDDAGVAHKTAVIRRALSINRASASDPLGALAAVGGKEIAFLTGVLLGSAERRVAVALDGFISTSAALVAHAIEPRVTDYIFACHSSAEPGHRAALDHLKLRPLLDLGLRLGEGTGAALGMLLIESATRLHSEMATFEQAGVSGRPPAARPPAARPPATET